MCEENLPLTGWVNYLSITIWCTHVRRISGRRRSTNMNTSSCLSVFHILRQSSKAFVNGVLRDMLELFVYVYLDDILNFAKSYQERVSHAKLVLQRLPEHQLYVNAEKCGFHASIVSFLGYIMSQGSIWMDPSKVKAVRERLQSDKLKNKSFGGTN